MKQLTNEQRRAIYELALNKINDEYFDRYGCLTGLCLLLEMSAEELGLKVNSYYFGEADNTLYEHFLFMNEITYNTPPGTKEGWELRKLMLMFYIEMTK